MQLQNIANDHLSLEFRVYLLSKAIHIVAAATKNIGGIVYDALKFLHHILYHDAPPTTHIKHMVYDIWFIYVSSAGHHYPLTSTGIMQAEIKHNKNFE